MHLKLGIALGGGGVRSAAQLGVVQALLESGIKPAIYAGTSGGAIVATLLALGYTPKQALEQFKGAGNFLDLALIHVLKGLFGKDKIQGVFKGNRLEKSLNRIFEGKRLGEVSSPLGISTTDLISGNQVIFTNMLNIDSSLIDYADTEIDNWSQLYLHDIVRASCSLPAVFMPKVASYRTLVDGGLTNNLPSDIAMALGADRVISVNLSTYGQGYELGGLPSILKQSLDVITKRNADVANENHDIVLNLNMADINLLDFTKLDECFNRGYEYAKANMGLIISELSKEEAV